MFTNLYINIINKSTIMLIIEDYLTISYIFIIVIFVKMYLIKLSINLKLIFFVIDNVDIRYFLMYFWFMNFLIEIFVSIIIIVLIKSSNVQI